MSWTVPKIWEGGECWILGGGPSLTGEFDIPDEVVQRVLSKELSMSAYSPYMTAIHDKHVIGVNMAFAIGSWVDVLFFGDKKWYLDRRHVIAQFKGLKITCHQFFDKPQFQKENVKCLRKGPASQGISSDPRTAVWNANSGAAAISVAANMGAKRIVLVGFDMKLDEDKNQHWHSEYATFNRFKNKPVREDQLPFRKHLAGFPRIAQEAKSRGIEIINACPDSAIAVFPKMTVKAVLAGEEIPALPKLPASLIRQIEKPRAPVADMVNPRKHGRIIKRRR